MNKILTFGITPCPNDVFSYFYWMKDGEEERGRPTPFEFELHDIEQLNRYAAKGRFDVTKMSFPAYLRNRDKYELLNAGAALGIGTGPVLVGRGKAEFFRRLNSDSPPKILVPGLRTTATALLKFFLAEKSAQIRSVHFRDIIKAVKKGEADYGALIHEGRFVYADAGLELVADLGEYWTWKTSLPVPLGCICIRKDQLGRKDEVEELIRESVRYAFANEEKTLPSVARHAQYLDCDILKKHIYSFVNEYSLDFSQIAPRILEILEGKK